MLRISLVITILLSSISLANTINVGSKKFTESVILGEIVTRIAASENIAVVHKAELGGTSILYNSLLNGEIDIYPDYSGTILFEILQSGNFSSFSEAQNYLLNKGIITIGPLGFNNTYALGMLKSTAQKYNINKISDLTSHPEITFGFTNEFMDRADGWPALQRTYRLPQNNVQGLDHDLAYKALETGSIQVMDLYSTDAEIKYYDLKVLEDDLNHFPEYYTYFLIRSELPEKYPAFVENLKGLVNKISEDEMVVMNAAAKLDKIPAPQIAARFIKEKLGLTVAIKKNDMWDRLAKNSKEHLIIVLISLAAAIIFSIPLGVLASRNERLAKIILGITGVIQTIPSLAILVFMIPLLGIGAVPAMMALFLYSLLPIVRNTYSGIKDIPVSLKESAIALGLKDWEQLWFVELPLAARSILAGIKTAAIINVGTATLGALIGAGGYGQPILTGIRLDDTGLILEGAIPAALLALLVQAVFDFAEKHMVKNN